MTAKCPYCGAEVVHEDNHGTLSSPQMCRTYACGTSSYYDGPSDRGAACLLAAPERPEIASPNVTEIGKTEIVVAAIPQELDAAKSGFAEEIAALHRGFWNK